MFKKNILVIEDESAIADTITYALSTEGFNPVWVSTGGEALEKINSDNFDLIIIDIGLPDISGFELLKIIRGTSSVPAIFLTARTDEIDKILGLELGADDYITKPFSPRELAARVKANVRRTGNMEQSTVQSSSFEIDSNKKKIFFRNSPLDLSFVEFKILSLLLANPGWVYTRDKIIEAAWDHSHDVYDRTVDAHIKSIRSKLKAVDSNADPITTHRGFGYSIKEDI